MPLNFLRERLALFIALVGFWIAPGLGFIALYFPAALTDFDAWKLLFFSAVIPTPFIAITTWAAHKWTVATDTSRDAMSAGAILLGGMVSLILEAAAWCFSLSLLTFVCIFSGMTALNALVFVLVPWRRRG